MTADERQFWLRPLPSAPASGPYGADEVTERVTAGAITWPGQQLLTGCDPQHLTQVITAVNTVTRALVYLESVVIEHRPAEDQWTPECWTTWPTWVGVDRPRGAGIGCSSPRLAERLQTAILAGAVLGPAEVRTDVTGKTYVSANHRVLARRLNTDLRRLGF